MPVPVALRYALRVVAGETRRFHQRRSTATLKDTKNAHNHKRTECHTDQTHEAEVGAVAGSLHPAAEWIVARLDSQCVSLNHSRSKDARDAKNCYRKAHGNSDESSKHRSKSTL